jgi:serine/threonine protein kinase
LHERLQADPRAIAALQHEFTQSQSLSHPNIARVYDFQQDGTISFLAMELVDGESLSRICERIAPRRLPHSRALAIVREIGLALAHAHERGTVHGNLHPSNVVITRNGNVRVHEFGQATAWLESMSATASDITRLNLKTSPQELRYASPQQKNYVPVDTTDDLYSLASIAHELLCGCPPESSAIENNSGKPRYARHLSTQQWRTLQRGLADDASRRGKEVRKWLADLDLTDADIRLPALQDLESGLEDDRLHIPKWFVPAIAASAAVIVIGVVGWFAMSRNAKEEAVSVTTPIPQANEAWNNAANEAAAASAANANPDQVANTPATESPAPITTPPAESRDTPVDIAAYPTISFAQSRYDVGAKDDVAKLVIKRTGPTNRTLRLEWFTIEGAARAYVDYMGDRNTSLTMSPGQETAVIEIPLIEDRQRDRATWFDVRIRATAEAMPGKTVVATVNLLPGNAPAAK